MTAVYIYIKVPPTITNENNPYNLLNFTIGAGHANKAARSRICNNETINNYFIYVYTIRARVSLVRAELPARDFHRRPIRRMENLL